MAESLGMAPNPSLSSLIAAVAEPWSSILADHRTAFATTSDEITRLAEENRTLISAGFRAAHETLLSIGGGVQTYTPAGTTVVEAACVIVMLLLSVLPAWFASPAKVAG